LVAHVSASGQYDVELVSHRAAELRCEALVHDVLDRQQAGEVDAPPCIQHRDRLRASRMADRDRVSLWAELFDVVALGQSDHLAGQVGRVDVVAARTQRFGGLRPAPAAVPGAVDEQEPSHAAQYPPVGARQPFHRDLHAIPRGRIN
jgi:hypothetical protein